MSGSFGEAAASEHWNRIEQMQGEELEAIRDYYMEVFQNVPNSIDLSSSVSHFNSHSPHVRSMFYELKTKLNDLDAVYGIPSDNDEVKFVPTDDQRIRSDKMNECINMFMIEMTESFEKFALAQQKCNTIRGELKTYVSLLNSLEFPLNENDEFGECTHSIISSLKQLTSHMEKAKATSATNRNHYWSQYVGLKNMCRLVDFIQSDPICKICYKSEIDIALNCGHTMCTSCSSKIIICPTCRQLITQKLRIFV